MSVQFSSVTLLCTHLYSLSSGGSSRQYLGKRKGARSNDERGSASLYRWSGGRAQLSQEVGGSPLKLNHFCFWTFNGSRKFAHLKFGNAKKSDICFIFARIMAGHETRGAGVKLGASAFAPGLGLKQALSLRQKY